MRKLRDDPVELPWGGGDLARSDFLNVLPDDDEARCERMMLHYTSSCVCTHAVHSRQGRFIKKAKVEKMLHASEILWVERVLLLAPTEILFTKDNSTAILDSVKVAMLCLRSAQL